MADLRGRITWRLFETLFRPWMALRVGDIHVAGLPRDLPADEPLLICPNHVSWWDGFLVRELQRRLRPEAPFRTLVLESEVRRHPFLRNLGAVALRPGSLTSFRQASRSLLALQGEDPGLVAAVFPQGRIVPGHVRPLGFRGGLALFRRMLQPCWVLPVALHLEFLDRPTAHAFVAAGTPIPPSVDEADAVGLAELRVRAELDAILDFVGRYGEEAPARWPAAAQELPRRRAATPPLIHRALPYRPWLSPN